MTDREKWPKFGENTSIAKCLVSEYSSVIVAITNEPRIKRSSNIERKNKKALNNERYIGIYLEQIKTVTVNKW